MEPFGEQLPLVEQGRELERERLKEWVNNHNEVTKEQLLAFLNK